MPLRWKPWIGLLACASAAGAWIVCASITGTSIARASEPLDGKIESLESPAGPGSGEGNLVAGADGNLYLSWIEKDGEGHVLKFSRWEKTGWSAPSPIARGDDWFVNWADVPGMIALADGILLAHWLAGTGSETEAYGIQVTRSGDGGKTWSAPVHPHRDATDTEHGFVSWAPLSGDRAALIWLDGRETAGADGDGAEHGHGAEHDESAGPMTLRATSVSADGTLGEDVLLDERACDCCNTDLAAMDDGSLLAVYRDRSEGEIRDISVMRFDGKAWGEGKTLHTDGWKIDGCPVNGPAVAVVGKNVAAAWFTVDASDHGHVRVAFSKDGGITFGAPIEVGGADPMGRVDVALLPGGEARVLWMEALKDGAAEIRVRGVDPEGTLGKSRIVVTTSDSRASGFPRMARHGDALFLAWTDPGDPPRVRTAVLR